MKGKMSYYKNQKSKILKFNIYMKQINLECITNSFMIRKTNLKILVKWRFIKMKA